MIIKSRFKHYALGIFIVSIFSLVLVITHDYASAFRSPPKPVSGHKFPTHGTVVRQLPPGHKTVWIEQKRYFYHDGVFYRRGSSGFVVIAAPVGAIVVDLPVGFIAVVIDGTTYYSYAGIYYQKVPAGYVVVKTPPRTVRVEGPAGSIVVQEAAPAVQSPSTIGKTVSVTAQILNVRSGPGMSHSVIRKLHQGDVLTISGYAPEWLYVRLPDGQFGWVMKKYTIPVAQPASG